MKGGQAGIVFLPQLPISFGARRYAEGFYVRTSMVCWLAGGGIISRQSLALSPPTWKLE